MIPVCQKCRQGVSQKISKKPLRITLIATAGKHEEFIQKFNRNFLKSND